MSKHPLRYHIESDFGNDTVSRRSGRLGFY